LLKMGRRNARTDIPVKKVCGHWKEKSPTVQEVDPDGEGSLWKGKSLKMVKILWAGGAFI